MDTIKPGKDGNKGEIPEHPQGGGKKGLLCLFFKENRCLKKRPISVEVVSSLQETSTVAN